MTQTAPPRRSALMISAGLFRGQSLAPSPDPKQLKTDAPFAELPFAEIRAREVGGSLTRWGYEVGHLVNPDGDEINRAVRGAIEAGNRDDHLIVYVIGHATFHDASQELMILGADGISGSGADIRSWISRALNYPVKVLFLLDVNYAGRVVQSPNRKPDQRVWVVGGTASNEAAHDGHFSEALAATLDRISADDFEVSGGSRFVTFPAFVEALRTAMSRFTGPEVRQSVTASEFIPTLEDEFSFFPNPRWVDPATDSSSADPSTVVPPDTAPAPAAVSGPLAGGISADWVDPNDSISLDRDQLSVGVYASMLAGVIAHRDTPMPLSIGLFGNWGSGKSYFMGLLRGEVERLAGVGPPAYLGDVVQIGFNAWHYTDTNLWASLGDEIFRQLAGPTEDVGSRRAALRSDLLELLEYRKVLRSRAQQAEQETVDLRAQLDQASAEHDATALDLVRALAASDEFKTRLSKVWSQLGIADEVERANALAVELRSAGRELSTARQLLSGRWARAAITGFVVGLCLLALAPVIPRASAWLAQGGFAILAGTLAAAVGIVSRFRTGLSSLARLAVDVRDQAKKATVDGKVVRPLLEKLRGAEAAQSVAQAQLDEVAARVGDLSRQLNDLAPGQRLYSFIAERATGDLYTRHLGLISTIRKDFQNLVALMRDWRDRADGDTSRRPIDRIVLYVDDLDRCSPKQVVDVLQAVHLLLALDLFVVVVGVDPRWLLESLQQHYDGILLRDGDDDRPDHRPSHAVMPEDYLEKIFNIPLVLPGMPPGSLDALFRSLTNRTDSMAYWREPEPVEETREVAQDPDGTADAATVVSDPAQMTLEPGSPLAADDPSSEAAAFRPMTEPELALLGDLEPLIDSPRDATRLLNLYRMLRSTRDLADASLFLGDTDRPGDYQAVIVLLGLLTAHARLLAAILDTTPAPDDGVTGGLTTRSPATTWSAFVLDLEPTSEPEGWVSAVCGPLADEDLADWHRVYAGASRSVRHVTLPDLTAFQRWAPRIRRFSFALSPLHAGTVTIASGRRSVRVTPESLVVTTGDGAADGSRPPASPRPRRRTPSSR